MLTREAVEKLRKVLYDEISRRRREAEKKKLPQKLIVIAVIMGKSRYKGHGYLYTYLGTDNNLKIEYDDYGRNILVLMNDRKVFCYSGGVVDCYIPGEWEEEVEKLHTVAREIAERRELEEEARKLREEAERWGIDIGSLQVG